MSFHVKVARLTRSATKGIFLSLSGDHPMTPFRLWFTVALLLACEMVYADATNPSKQPFGGLPLELAIKQVRGNGLRAFATFEDPYCPYCKRLALATADMTDVTIYTFLYPVLTPSSRKTADAIWCAPNRNKAWATWMSSGRIPKAPACNTGTIDQILALGKSMKIRGVPTIFLANGERYTGEKSKLDLEMAISSPTVMRFQAELKNKRISP